MVGTTSSKPKKYLNGYLISFCRSRVTREEMHVWMCALHITVNLFNDLSVLQLTQIIKISLIIRHGHSDPFAYNGLLQVMFTLNKLTNT